MKTEEKQQQQTTLQALIHAYKQELEFFELLEKEIEAGAVAQERLDKIPSAYLHFIGTGAPGVDPHDLNISRWIVGPAPHILRLSLALIQEVATAFDTDQPGGGQYYLDFLQSAIAKIQEDLNESAGEGKEEHVFEDPEKPTTN